MNDQNKTQALTRPPVTIVGCLQTQRWKDEVSKVLPAYLTPEMMLRIARSVASDQRFANCTPESFLLALIKCARAGLVPDGRNAYLIPFGTEVQAIFDWKGMVAMASRNGVQVTPKLVFSNDKFSVEEDDGTGQTRVLHKVDFTKPRGEIVLVYSRARNLKGGDVDYEFMTAEEVEDIRINFSPAKNSLMWTKSWGEAAKKTVIRRHSKRWDLSPEDRAALNSDDDSPKFEDRPAVSVPLFQSQTPPKVIETVQSEPEQPATTTPQSSPEPEDDVPSFEQATSQPQASVAPPVHTQAAPVPPPEPPSKLKLIRQACKAAKIKEGVLVGYLAETGNTDGSPATLEEVAMQFPKVIDLVVDKWSVISKTIIDSTKGGSR